MNTGQSNSGPDAGAPACTSPSGARILVRGQVQGVGFRPFVFRLAADLLLTGSVRNDPSGVIVDLFGPPSTIATFLARLQSELPPLAHIADFTSTDLAGPSPADFKIVPSTRGGIPDRVTIDSAICPGCLHELLDPADRRFQHALINCTNCGPRYTIVRDVPYDRPLTTMAAFPMCDICSREYRDPGNRRFHAQPTCCPCCGPRLAYLDSDPQHRHADAIAAAATALRAGSIVAIKGLGGYHLAVDATSSAAVARLRAGKKRDHKPFALLVDSLESARQYVRLSSAAESLLQSPAAPIVLAPRVANSSLAAEVAPGMHRLGVMLPHTPIQHLLMRQGFRVLVMTSANVSDDPLIIDDSVAISGLSSIADAWLTHDRPIQRAVDDSVHLDAPTGIIPIRRARGFVPAPLALPVTSPSDGICLGGELKNAISVVHGSHATLSQHIGDLSFTLAFERFRTTIEDLTRLLRITPSWIACDSHPGYISHRHARALARSLRVPLLEIQHHHAHLASVMAEYRRTEPTIGIICDGVGYGADGTIWGGELLLGDLTACSRFARLRPLRLPGGDAAAKHVGRCALAWLDDACSGHADRSSLRELDRRLFDAPGEYQAISAMLASGINCPLSSGAGRLFDAAAALLGLCRFNHYEAMSGLLLEAAATDASSPDDDLSDLIPLEHREGLLELDHRPLARRLARGVQAAESPRSLARLFHEALADGLARAAQHAAAATGVRTVALSGGVFCNSLLTSLLSTRLQTLNVQVLLHREAPPNDGGLALGQAAIAAARLATPGA